MQPAAPTAEYLPGGQLKLLPAPVLASNEPAAQLEQLPVPAALCLPTPQLVQPVALPLAPLAYFPATQVAQVSAPRVAAKAPGGHGAHAAAEVPALAFRFWNLKQ